MPVVSSKVHGPTSDVADEKLKPSFDVGSHGCWNSLFRFPTVMSGDVVAPSGSRMVSELISMMLSALRALSASLMPPHPMLLFETSLSPIFTEMVMVVVSDLEKTVTDSWQHIASG